jgi:hypothetical protein
MFRAVGPARMLAAVVARLAKPSIKVCQALQIPAAQRSLSVNGGSQGGNNQGAGGTTKLGSSIGGNFSGLSGSGAGAASGAGHSGGGVAAAITTFFSSASESTASSTARGGSVRGAPGPVAGAGLPFLFLVGGIAFLVVRKSRRRSEQMRTSCLR